MIQEEMGKCIEFDENGIDFGGGNNRIVADTGSRSATKDKQVLSRGNLGEIKGKIVSIRFLMI